MPKPLARVYLLLAATAVGGPIVTGRLPGLRAAEESAQPPSALLLVERRPPRVLSSAVETGPLPGDQADDYKRFLETQRGLIKSRLVVRAALQDKGVSQLASVKSRTDPIAWLQQHLEVSHLKDSELLRMSLAPASGASGKEQAAIINAIARTYLEEVVNVEVRMRTARHDQLVKLRMKYAEMLRERRQTVRQLRSTVGVDPPTAIESGALPSLYQNLMTQRLQLRLERTEAETLLARRKKAASRRAGTEPNPKEIDQIEDRLAGLIARQKVLDEELENMRQTEMISRQNTLDLEDLKDDIAQMQASARKIGAEVEALNIELGAPPRVRLIDLAEPPLK